MFTTFRCLTDGCSSPDGTPLPVHMQETHGWLFVCMYVFSVLFVLCGVFNLIAAVFVENTLDAAKSDAEKRKELRYKEHIKTAQSLQALVLKLCSVTDSVSCSKKEKRQHTLRRFFTIKHDAP